MAVVMAKAILVELRDTSKVTHKHLSCASGDGKKGGRFSWGQTTHEQHKAGLGKMATNDMAENPFAGLTNQMGCFGTLLGMNRDFKRKDVNGNKKNGTYTYHLLPTILIQN